MSIAFRLIKSKERGKKRGLSFSGNKINNMTKSVLLYISSFVEK